MNRDTVIASIQEAQRFLDRAQAYLDKHPPRYEFLGSRVSGALRRSSMDLTRSLADLRGRT